MFLVLVIVFMSVSSVEAGTRKCNPGALSDSIDYCNVLDLGDIGTDPNPDPEIITDPEPTPEPEPVVEVRKRNRTGYCAMPERCGLKVTQGVKPVYVWDVLKLGDRGEDVKTMQIVLNLKGANLVVDGIYGPLTLKAFQEIIK